MREELRSGCDGGRFGQLVRLRCQRRLAPGPLCNELMEQSRCRTVGLDNQRNGIRCISTQAGQSWSQWPQLPPGTRARLQCEQSGKPAYLHKAQQLDLPEELGLIGRQVGLQSVEG